MNVVQHWSRPAVSVITVCTLLALLIATAVPAYAEQSSSDQTTQETQNQISAEYTDTQNSDSNTTDSVSVSASSAPPSKASETQNAKSTRDTMLLAAAGSVSAILYLLRRKYFGR